jgi:ABC-type amino acid transport substrate-binding protein
MSKIKKFKEHINIGNFYNEIDILKQAKDIISNYKNSEEWNIMFEELSKKEIEFVNWDDLTLLYYWLKYAKNMNNIEKK